MHIICVSIYQTGCMKCCIAYSYRVCQLNCLHSISVCGLTYLHYLQQHARLAAVFDQPAGLILLLTNSEAAWNTPSYCYMLYAGMSVNNEMLMDKVVVTNIIYVIHPLWLIPSSWWRILTSRMVSRHVCS